MEGHNWNGYIGYEHIYVRIYIYTYHQTHDSLDHRPGAGVLEGAVPQVQLLQPGLLPAFLVFFWGIGVGCVIR